MNDRDIWISAQQMIGLHGAKAADEANMRAIGFMNTSDFQGAAVWRRIATTVLELERQERGAGESVN